MHAVWSLSAFYIWTKCRFFPFFLQNCSSSVKLHKRQKFLIRLWTLTQPLQDINIVVFLPFLRSRVVLFRVVVLLSKKKRKKKLSQVVDCSKLSSRIPLLLHSFDPPPSQALQGLLQRSISMMLPPPGFMVMLCFCWCAECFTLSIWCRKTHSHFRLCHYFHFVSESCTNLCDMMILCPQKWLSLFATLWSTCSSLRVAVGVLVVSFSAFHVRILSI